MNTDKMTQQRIIQTSVGNRYVATYAGTIGKAQYFECKKPDSNISVGYVATLDNKKFGPLCPDYVTAALRACNVADARGSWFAQLFVRQK